MARLLLIALFFVFVGVTGCAHLPVLAFPAGTVEPDPELQQTPEASVPNTLHAPLVARATRADVWRTACALGPSISVGGRTRPIDLRVDAKPCSTTPSPSGIGANVDGYKGVVDLDVPEGATPEEVAELRQGLTDISNELARRLRSLQPLPTAAASTEQRSLYTPKPTKKSTKWLSAAGALGVIGLVFLGIGAGMSSDRQARGAGEAILISAALPLGVASVVTGIVGFAFLAGE